MRAAHAANDPVRRFVPHLAIELKKIVCFVGELLHTSTMPAWRMIDAPPQMEMTAEKVAATEEVAAEALAAWHYEYFGKVRQPAVKRFFRTSVAR
jgi:TorA maturation chaperone TorD